VALRDCWQAQATGLPGLSKLRCKVPLVGSTLVEAHLHGVHSLEALEIVGRNEVLHQVRAQDSVAVAGGESHWHPHAAVQHPLHHLLGTAATQAPAAIQLHAPHLAGDLGSPGSNR